MDEAQDSNIIPFDKRARKAWEDRCTRGKKGLVSNVANALNALRLDPDLRDVYAFDEMVQTVKVHHEIGRIETCDRWLTDADVVSLQVWLQENGFGGIGLETVRSAITVRASEEKYHPVRDYLRSLLWDQVPRLKTWLAVYLGSELNVYTESVGKMWLLSMVARIAEPGCQVDHMPVLEGQQGTLKSSACKILGGEWFSDNLPEVTSQREASQHLRGKWLIEVSEMHSMNRAEATLLKSFISRRTERYLARYGRNEVNEPRQCVFAGTTNQDAYLKDPTGGRRFWPVRTGRIDLEALERDRDLLFAEAVEAYRLGDPWWPDRSLEEVFKPEQAARYAGDIWEDRIEQHLRGRSRCTVAEVAKEALGIVEAHMRQEHSLRIAGILREAGWVLRRAHGVRVWKREQNQFG